MENDGSTYALNAQQFEQALAILQREQQANTPSPRQEKIFKLLNFSIYVLGIAGGIVVLSSLLALGIELAPGSPYFVLLLYFFLTDVIGFISSILSIILSVGILILFFSNLSYVRQLLRQNKLVRLLGLKEALRVPWKAERRKKRLHNLLVLGLRIPGPLLMLFVGGNVFLKWLEDLGYVVTKAGGVLFLGVLLSMASAAIIATYFGTA